MNVNFGAMRVATSGQTVTAPNGSSSAATALPTNAAAKIPQYVRVQADGVVTIRFGDSGVSAAGTDTRLNPNNFAVFEVIGYTHFAVFGPAASNPVNVVAIET